MKRSLDLMKRGICVKSAKIDLTELASCQVIAPELEPDLGYYKIVYKGFNMPNSIPFIERVRNFPVDPDDVFIAGFPKSGSSLIKRVVWYLMTEDYDNDEPLSKLFPTLDYPLPHPVRAENLDALIDKTPPRLFQTHYPACLLPRSIHQAKLIYVCRNPKEVVVSTYNFYRSHTKTHPIKTFDEFAGHFLRENLWYSPWHKHVKSYLEAEREFPGSILVVCSNDMNVNPLRLIRRIASFLGKDDLAEEVYQRICDYSAEKLEVDKAKVASNYGDWRAFFTPQLESRFNDYLTAHLSDCDLQFY